LKNIPIYYTVSLIDKCRNIYETYIDMLSKKIRERFYKEEVQIVIFRPILSNIGIYTISKKILVSMPRKKTRWLSCALLACFRMDSPGPSSNGGATTPKTESASLGTAQRAVSPVI
jgi:hypothetical protein